MSIRNFLSHLILIFVFLLVPASISLAEDWKPIDPAHLAMKSPVVEKDADAEAIFWEVHVDDAGTDLVFNNYIRIKIFTDRGKESQSKIDILYNGKYNIKDIAGRTIKADGSIVELKKDAVFDRTVIKLSGIKVKAKSFAMPGVEPGAIIEYRWKEVRPFKSADNVRLQFQRDIPVQLVKYYLKPDPNRNDLAGMRTLTFQGKPQEFKKEGNGFYSTQMTNMPAFHEEPRMPPEDQVRTWMLVYYSSRDEKQSPEKYWGELGKRVAEYMKPQMKVNDDIKKAAATIVGDASTPDEKLNRILNFVRTEIKNVSDDASGATEEERKKMKEDASPADTLKRKMGTSPHIDYLFAALATAAGFEARLAMLPDRGDFFFDPKLMVTTFLSSGEIAVKVGDEWRFFDPSTTYVPSGMLPWEQEGVSALILDPKEPIFVETPLSPPEKSKELRVGNFRLSEDGTLEGDVRISYTGHLAYQKKEENDSESPEKREENLREMIKKRMSTAEISNISIANVKDAVKPFLYTFHVKIPGYAQRTGKRLFLQPAFFQYGLTALFPTSERKYSIYFHYPWSEEDVVTIDLPPGFALDNADAPQPFSVDKIGNYDVRIGITTDKKTLEYRRKFFFCGEKKIMFPTVSYATLKKIFDLVHEADSHTISLKQSAAQ